MKLVTVGILAVAILAQLGCSRQALVQTSMPPLSAEARARFAALSPAEAIQEAETKINSALQARLDFYSPQHFREAYGALTRARQLSADRQAPREAVFSQIVSMESALRRAEANRQKVESEMVEVFKLQQALDHANASQFKEHIYNKLMHRVEALISYIEAGNEGQFQADLPDLIAEMSAFETDTIVYNALNAAALALQEAEQVDAPEYAPKSFNKARYVYERAEKQIRAQPHNSKNVSRLGRAALVEAKHAFYVSQEVKALQEIKKDRMEQIVLEEEARLRQIAEILSIKQLHDRPVDDQASVLATTVYKLLKSGAITPQLSPAMEKKSSDQAAMAPIERNEQGFTVLSEEQIEEAVER